MTEQRRRKIAVLMGGTSAEREISLSTGRQVLQALDPSRYDAFAVDAATDLLSLAENQPDCVFITLHGPSGEDGSVQGFLELCGLAYTGSGVLASALAMDKAMCKKVFASEDIPCPWSTTVGEARVQLPENVTWPLVVKPNRQGSSFGLSIVRNPEDLPEAMALALSYDTEALVETFLSGVEITVSVLGNRCPQVLPTIEIVPRAEFYDYASKYEPGGSRHIIPARISKEAAGKAADLAVRCHHVLGCRGMSRTDMIVDQDEVWVLEVNTIPGMTPTSLLPDAAAAAGISFSALLDRVIDYALET